MKKSYLILSLFIVAFISGHAQIDSAYLYNSLQDGVRNADYIIEGEIIYGGSFWNERHTDIYTSYILQPRQVWKQKGVQQYEFYEIVVWGGTVNGESMYSSHGIQFARGEKGIFFLKENPPAYSTEGHEPEVKPVEIYKGKYIPFESHPTHDVFLSASYAGHVFECLDQVYALIDDEYIADCLNFIPNGSLQQMDGEVAWQQVMDLKEQSRQQEGDTAITLTIENAYTSGTSTKYFEFDIYAKASHVGTYYWGGIIFINYNQSTFGSNVVANSNVVVQRGAAIASITAYTDPSLLDQGANLLAIMTAGDANGTRPQLGTYPTKLVHVKLEIQDCNNGASLSFGQDPLWGPSLQTYTNSGTSLVTTDYLLNTGPPHAEEVCVAEITGFSPQVVHGGVKEVVTVTGAGFGNAPGKIELPSSDQGHSYKELNPEDIISWTDSEIKFYAPSVLYSQIGNNPIEILAVGSGRIRIENLNNDIILADDSLIIDYAWKNYITDLPSSPLYEKDNSILPGKDNVYIPGSIGPAKRGLTLLAHPDVFNNQDMMNCIRKAMKDWTCATEIRWRLGEEIPLSSITLGNDYNNIYFGPVTNADFAAETRMFPGRCGNAADTSDPITFTPEFDIRLNANMNWHFDSTGTDSVPPGKIDFYAVILHELGHAHQLMHVNQKEDLMYYHIPSGGTAGIDWLHRKTNFSLADIAGGEAIVEASVNVDHSICNEIVYSMESMSTSGCTFQVLGIDNVPKGSLVKAYPNPTKDVVYLEVDGLFLQTLQEAKLYDVNGRSVGICSKEMLLSEKRIDLQFLTPGIYFLVLMGTHSNESLRLVKQ